MSLKNLTLTEWLQTTKTTGNAGRQSELSSGKELAILSITLLASGLPISDLARPTRTAGILLTGQGKQKIETTFTKHAVPRPCAGEYHMPKTCGTKGNRTVAACRPHMAGLMIGSEDKDSVSGNLRKGDIAEIQGTSPRKPQKPTQGNPHTFPAQYGHTSSCLPPKHKRVKACQIK